MLSIIIVSLSLKIFDISESEFSKIFKSGFLFLFIGVGKHKIKTFVFFKSLNLEVNFRFLLILSNSLVSSYPIFNLSIFFYLYQTQWF